MHEEEYRKLLNAHDWTYEFSDDHRWYTKGLAERKKLLSLAYSGPELMAMYEAKKEEVFPSNIYTTYEVS